jgi:acyl-CoA synthetase (AMP-forming)/AMP-acid ligase II
VAGVRTGGVVAASHLPEGAAGEQLVLLVEPAREAAAPSAAGLAEACRRAVLGAVGLLPGAVVVLAPGSLPRTSSGKLRRGEALARWLAGELAAAPAPAPPAAAQGTLGAGGPAG